MTLSRRYLEEGQMRALYLNAVTDGRALTDEELSASLTETLAKKPKGAGWWVFGYGSLLWNPLFPVAEARAATIHGLHRRFCLHSLASRGTPDQPGLVLALEPAASAKASSIGCRRRSRSTNYICCGAARWWSARTGRAGCKRVRAIAVIAALTFVVRRDHVQYAHLSDDEQARIIAQACGAFGSSCDYLMRTRAALASHGIVDAYLERLARDVQLRQLTCAAPIVAEVK
jgi:cation transport protein ChaC